MRSSFTFLPSTVFKAKTALTPWLTKFSVPSNADWSFILTEAPGEPLVWFRGEVASDAEMVGGAELIVVVAQDREQFWN